MECSDIKQKGIAITLDKERHIVYDLNSFCELEDKYGSIDKALDGLSKNPKIKDIRYILYLGLENEDEALTEKQVGSMVTLSNLNDVMDTVTKAISISMPEGKNIQAPGAKMPKPK